MSGAKEFRKKPVIIEALQWRVSNHEEVKAFLGDDYVAVLSKHSPKPAHISIRTLEGTIYAAPGDWIIRGIHGEHYPCKPDIFEGTYDPVGTEGLAEKLLAYLDEAEAGMNSWGTCSHEWLSLKSLRALLPPVTP